MDKLEQAVKYTKEMLSLAKKDEWQQVLEIDKERQQIIHDAFNNTPLRVEQAQLTEQLVSMQQELLSLSTSAHQTSQAEIQQLNHGKKAIQSYEDTNPYA